MEIGSVLELDEYKYYLKNDNFKINIPLFVNNTFSVSCFQSGRNAIELLAKQLIVSGIDTFLVPEFVCSTVPDAILRAGGKIFKYNINEDLSLNLDSIPALANACFYFVHFFGRRPTDTEINTIKNLQNNGMKIIEDITMSLLSFDKSNFGFGDYLIGSLRKWFPIPDGGFVASKRESIPQEPTTQTVSLYSHLYYLTQDLKRQYISTNCSDKLLKDTYLSYYADSTRELFSDYRIYPISQSSKYYLSNCDIDKIITRRKDNYDLLYSQLKDTPVKPLVQRVGSYVPFGMTIITNHRDELLKYLIEHDIYCNVHWRLSGDISETTAKLSNNIMTIPCDQRYNVEHMKHIVKEIKEFFNDRI